MEHILVVDDEAIIRTTLERILTEEGYQVTSVSTGAEALAHLGRSEVDLVLLDLNLPDRNGIDVLRQAKELDPDLLVIVVTGYASVESAVEALKLGAYDYIKKPFKADVIKLITRLALEAQRLKKEVHLLRRRLKVPAADRIVAESSQMRQVMRQVGEVARHENATVLVTGESGTGKEVVAQSIHYLSPRKEQPFVEINCATLPENLLESELFGHEKGAFTDAVQRKKGLFETAQGGTMFLDEIGEIPQALQAKLLGVLERRRFRRLGGTRDIAADVRIIAATNIDPLEAIRERRFREDLYYRLNVFPIHVPPLRERPEDTDALARLFLMEFSGQFHKDFKDIDADAQHLLQQYRWPGNVRELRNVMERICIMYNDGRLRPAHLPREIVTFEACAPGIDLPDDLLDIDSVVDSVTRQLIGRALARTDGNTARAARLLGIPRGTLRYKMKKYHLAD
ncbi:MAG: sigma-54 dependent transcriptional regulator [Desulfobacteraceae bacterium]|nr:sigma-54 dependent transcriptional regulator [Desulfobacteraceae bacterium]